MSPTLRGRAGNPVVRAAALTERGGCRPVILMEYGTSGGSEVMFTQQSHRFLHVTPDGSYMVARGGE